MRQIVDEIVHSDPIRQRRPLLLILRIIRPLPGVAQIHVVADGDDDPPLFVANAAPVRDLAAGPLLVSQPGFEVLSAGNLEPLIEIVERMKDRIVVRNVLDRR